jgi:tRNA A37 N6-isopentenylltransferase MiaA
LLVLGSVLAFLLLDPILGAFLGILGGTGLGIAWLARDWEHHPGFEERERVRARKRAEKRERTAGARARDRERWEAHQAKQAGRAER